jgi:hypothetical protein
VFESVTNCSGKCLDPKWMYDVKSETMLFKAVLLRDYSVLSLGQYNEGYV